MKRKYLKLSMLLAVIMIGSALQLSAQDEQSSTTTQQPNGIADDQFIAKNIKDNKQEAELAKMALEKSENENIKTVAGILVEHHTQMAADLSKLPGAQDANNEADASANENINNQNANSNAAASTPGDTGTASNQLDITGNKTSADIDAENKQDAMAAQTGGSADPQSMLASASGETFDSLWVKQMLIKHKIKLGELHQAKKSVSDPKLKEMIDEAIPTVREHRDLLTEIQNNPDEPVKIHNKHGKDKVAQKKSKTNHH